MKYLRILLILVVFASPFLSVGLAKAQCSVCSTNVETNKKSGGSQANGLNNGIMYLLAAPYIAIGAVGFLWYKKYRRKNVNLNMRDDKFNLN